MAKINQGFLGNAKGKLGNVVFAKWRDVNTARQYQPDVHDAKTPAQLKQRSRMYNLLQFLKPLNKNFIKFYNSTIAKGSTPWALAIKNNMDFVSPEGCFIPENLSFGAPKFPAPEITDVTYNPFIDQTTVKYKHRINPALKNPFPYVGTSVLAKYNSDSGVHEFDTRHLLCFLPEGSFFCSFYGGGHEHVFENWWGHGWLWMMYYDTYEIESHYDPNNGLSEPVGFTPVSIIEGFNTKVKENPVPVEAISTEYRKKDDKITLLLNLDYKQVKIKNLKDYSIVVWGLGLHEGKQHQTMPIQWDLSKKTLEIELIDSIAKGTFIVLYSVYKKSGEQVACFNRFYIDKNVDGKSIPLFWQLFICWYAHPSSFILEGNQCGFCGSVDELFSDFIQLWEQGIIHEDNGTLPENEKRLTIFDNPAGKVEATGFIREVDGTMIYELDTKAVLAPKPKDGYVFNTWTGEDAADVIKIKEGVFELSMSKDRNISADFKSLV